MKTCWLKVLPVLLLLASCVTAPGGDTSERVIRVPHDAPTIQQAIDLAAGGETILIAPGVYRENLRLSAKSFTLASHYYTTRESSYRDQTILDGQGGESVIEVADGSGTARAIIGLTIRNATIGIAGRGEFQVLHNRIADTDDGVLWRGGKGVLRSNLVESCRDDGIDLHGPTGMLIEDNVIRNCADDGIEVRLQEYSGPFLEIDILNNRIYGSGENGIQVVGYPSHSSRVFQIRSNVIAGSRETGLALMSGHSAAELQDAGIPERVYLINNTFIDNDCGISGGRNVIALNNIIVGSRLGISRMGGNSIGSHFSFWNNGSDYEASNIDPSDLVLKEPLLDDEHRPAAGSPLIDAGTATFTWNSEVVLDRTPDEYSGGAPDLGALEYRGLNPSPESRDLSPETN